MLKRTQFTFMVAAALFLAGCQTGAVPDPTPSVTISPENGPAVLPSSTPTESPAPSPTAVLPQESETSHPSPAPTEVPTETVFAGPCFTVREANPFAFTPDGQGIALRSIAGVEIVDLETMEEETFLEAPLNLYSAALSPDGEILAWSLEDNSIQLVRVEDQTVLHTLEGHPDPVFKLRFSPSGERLYSTSHDTLVRVWDLEGNLVQSIQPEIGEVLGIGISTDGSTLAAIPSDGPVVLWDLANDQKQGELISGTGGYDTSDASFSPDGQHLAADLATGLFVWRVSDGGLAWEQHPNTMTGEFSPDGRYFAYADLGQGNRVFLLSPEDFQPVTTLEMNPDGAAWSLFFSAEGSRLAASDGIEVRIWEVEEGEQIAIGRAECP